MRAQITPLPCTTVIDRRWLDMKKAASYARPFLTLDGLPEVLPDRCISRELPCAEKAVAEVVELARDSGAYAAFRVVGDCMERAGIEDGGWVAVDFTHMPRTPKYGPGGYIDPCLCLARWESRGRSLVMVKAYTGKWGQRQTVSTQYADQWAGEDWRMDVGLFAEAVYGVVFAAWGRDGRLRWRRDPSGYPEKLPAASTIRGENIGFPQGPGEVRL